MRSTVHQFRVDLLLTFGAHRKPRRRREAFEGYCSGRGRTPLASGHLASAAVAARAELALARQDRSLAIEEAATAAVESRALGRPKYGALALITSARALGELHRTHEGAANARRAIAFARRTGDPALLLSALDVLLAVDGDDASLAEARTLVNGITAAWQRPMRRCEALCDIGDRAPDSDALICWPSPKSGVVTQPPKPQGQQNCTRSGSPRGWASSQVVVRVRRASSSKRSL